ncbi:MAG: nucleotidyltransferase family protein [Candidatus Eisenbacteria bacterium]
MISAVVLAAGESRRMGRKKETLPVRGEPMVRGVVTKLLESAKIDEVIVVLGHQADDVGAALAGVADERIELVGNRRYREGMGTSLAHGVSSCSWGSGAFVIVLADAPFFRTEDVDALIDAHAAGNRIVVPARAGRRGHPAIIDGSFRDELEALSGDAGGRHLLERHADSVFELELEDEGFLVDVDTPDDYEAVKDGIDSR